LLEDEPRFDYSSGATCPSLLLEPSRTNLVTQSEYFATYFSTSGTLIYNEAASPEGVQNGTKIYPTSTGSFKGLSKAFGSTLSSTPYALSVFAKAGEFEHLYFYNVGSPNGANGVWFNLTTGSVGTNQAAWTSAKMEDFGNGWYRCSAVITPGGSSDNLYILLADSNGSVTATTNGTDGFYIYGAQLEQGSYPTSYIPNHSGGSVTRGADAMNNSSLGLTDCTFFVDFVPLSSIMGLLDFYDNSNARVFYAAFSSARFITFNSVLGGTIGNVGPQFNLGETIKLAFTLNASTGDVTIFINGIKYSTYSTTISSLNKILQVASFGYYNNTKFNQILTFGETLSDAECITLTTI
jgi:hypothetical protein